MERSLSEPLGEEELASLAAHLDECEICRTRAGAGPPQAALEADLARAETVRSQASVDVTVPLARLNELLGGEYEIIGEIGRGGMGIVYQARQIELDRMVALKVLPALLGLVRPDAMARFRREASLAARLKHTNIIAVHDFGQVEGTLYYAMELIEGRSLREILREINETGAIDVVLEAGSGSKSEVGSGKSEVRGEASTAVHSEIRNPTSDIGTSDIRHPTSVTRLGSSSSTDKAYYHRVARWIADVAEALDYAHEQGVIHRDVKPSNLLLAPDGRMMISDFGLARASGVESLTASRSLLGTCRYMSPEQVDETRGAIGHGVDVYALGATLYELLAFRPMFAARDDREVLSHVLDKEPTPPQRFVKQVPRELETICLKAVEKDRASRYADAKAMADDLRRWLLDLPIHARRPSLPARAVKFVRRRKVPVALGAVAAALLIVASVLYSGYHSSRQQEAETRALAESQGLELLVFEAEDLLRSGRFATALVKVEGGLAESPDSVSLHCLRGETLLRMNRDDEAVRCLEDTIARYPDCWQAHIKLATVYSPGFGSAGPYTNYNHRLANEQKAAYHHRQVERLMPEAAEAYYVRARNEPDPEQALELLNKAIELDPSSIFHFYERSRRFADLGRYAEMLLDAERAVAMRSGWAITYIQRGIALWGVGRYQEALSDFSRAIELDPKLAVAWQNSALAKIKMGRFAEAIADASEAIRLDPHYSKAYQCRARARAGLGDVEEALADYAEAIRLKPTSVEAYLDRGFLCGQAGRWEDVINDSARVIQLRPEDPRGYENRAFAYMRTGQLDRQIADLAQYLRLKPEDAEAWRSRGLAHARAGRYAQAIDDYGRAIALKPEAADLRTRATYNFRLERYAEAVADLTQAIDLEPTHPSAWMFRGMTHEITGAVEAALADYQQAATRNGPTSAYARLWQYALLQESGRADAAAALLTAPVRPADAGAWTDHLFALFSGRLPAEDLLAAAATDDERAEAYYYIGRKALLDGRCDEAEDAFAACVALDRNDVMETDFARALLKQLDEPRQPPENAP